MPFAVFRRHQRKLLAIFAILAMFGFVVADSLPRLLSSGQSGAGNPTVVTLYKHDVHRSDIAQMQYQRNLTNLFMGGLIARLYGQNSPQFFGPLNTRALVDALVLQHEADRLGMPVGPDVGRNWLKQRYGAKYMTRELFDELAAQFSDRVSGEQLLSDIANQVRLSNVRMLLGSPVVTPLDIFQTYRDQNERVSVRAVGFPVEDYLGKVGEPSSGEVQAYYDLYKNNLPDPNGPTPGFKIPRKVQVEALSIDGEALGRGMKDQLTEAELRTYYENRKADFKVPSELPEVVFAEQGDAKAADLTPPQIQQFAEVRPYLATSLAEEKAQKEIVEKFRQVKDDVMIPFLDKVDAFEEAKKSGEKTAVALPVPDSLESIAEKEGLQYRITGLLSREEAQHQGALSSAEVGLNRLSGGRKFPDEVFDPKSALFEPIELTDFSGQRFLLRKLQDVPPRVPVLDEIRGDVVLAWKKKEARKFAQQAADELSAKLEREGGKITGDVVAGHKVTTTDPVARLQIGLPLPGRIYENGPPTPSDIQLPAAGNALRDAYFGLDEKDVAVAPNEPQTVYYVLTLNRRIPATFAALYAPNGDLYRYRNDAFEEALKKHDDEWMSALRKEAGLEPGWVPSDEAKEAKEKEAG
jgi:hypothetical protein